MNSASSGPSSRLRASARAAGLMLGAGVLVWRVGAIWTWAALVFAGGLLVLALAAPRAFAPVDRALVALQNGVVKAISWILLGLVFGLIFVPGRVIAAASRRSTRWSRSEKMNTYWRTPTNDNTSAGFDRQF